MIQSDTPQTDAFWKSMEGYCDTYEIWTEKAESMMKKLEREGNLAKLGLLSRSIEIDEIDPEVRRLEIHHDMNERMGE